MQMVGRNYFLKPKGAVTVLLLTVTYITSYVLYFSYTTPGQANSYLYWLERKLKVRPSYVYQGASMQEENEETYFPANLRVLSNETCPEKFYEMNGKMSVNVDEINLDKLNLQFSGKVKYGGNWSPEDCIPKWNVGFLIPFRNRHYHLPILLRHLIPMLMIQHIKFTIYVINQEGNQRFNRAMLLNVGYLEALKMKHHDCFIFHDVDHLPENNRNYYGCTDMPRQFRVLLDVNDYSLEYPTFFGGVTGLTTEQFKKVNGFSNEFWGWGGEDDDLYARVNKLGYNVSSATPTRGRYSTLQKNHHQESQNLGRFNLLTSSIERNSIDGLNSLRYQPATIETHKLFTNISVDLQPVKMLNKT
ncbi:beta-1,4-galactosyltransferase 6-like isoform X1 [Clavelina lepadiformis]|uniref:beta-1,4-galactosyltransferase 6-like isoform X1 n=2 Tax=Clavelina lepadiformis TaxID=159417 RepID=UPI0040432B1D